MSYETLPKSLRHIRACMACSLVKTFEQFEADGCDNCESFLMLQHNRAAVQACTSANFSGMVGMADRAHSWVARWQRIRNFKRGVYAISVMGDLPQWARDNMAAERVVRVDRDVSQDR